MEWLNADTLQLAGIVGIIAFLWKLQRDMHRDIANLRERMARLEGVVETLRDTIAGRQTP